MARDLLCVFYGRLAAAVPAEFSSSHVSVALPGPRSRIGSRGRFPAAWDPSRLPGMDRPRLPIFAFSGSRSFGHPRQRGPSTIRCRARCLQLRRSRRRRWRNRDRSPQVTFSADVLIGDPAADPASIATQGTEMPAALAFLIALALVSLVLVLGLLIAAALFGYGGLG
jgi:hypothetical protein